MEKFQLKVPKTYKDGKAMTISQMKEYFSSLTMEQIPSAIKIHELDSRIGVHKICKQYDRKYEKYINECIRAKRLKEFDQVFAGGSEYLLAGVDEAGRGPLAGPVVAAAVVLPADINIIEINDSKKISESRREALYQVIMDQALSVGVGIVSAKDIDGINILQATFLAMRKAIDDLDKRPDVLLIDGNQGLQEIPYPVKQHTVIEGDAKSLSIAAASIIAKVTRDRMMRDYHDQYPVYGFASNKGYGSKLHQECIQAHGPCPIHRQTFIKNIWDGNK